MPAKDLYHDAFVRSLQKEGWTITHDPLVLKVDETDLFLDLGAEKFVTAERGNERIAVEVKSFVNRSGTQELERSVGQFIVYSDALHLSVQHADRILYVAIRTSTYLALFETGPGKMLLNNHRLRLIVFDAEQEEIRQWIP